MEIDDGLLAFFAEEEGVVGGVVDKEVFGEFVPRRVAFFVRGLMEKI